MPAPRPAAGSRLRNADSVVPVGGPAPGRPGEDELVAPRSHGVAWPL
jgi:hypothetical protein